MSKWGEQNEKLLRLVGLSDRGGRTGWGGGNGELHLQETRQLARLHVRRENGSGQVGI